MTERGSGLQVRMESLPRTRAVFAEVPADAPESVPRVIERLQAWVIGHKQPAAPVVLVHEQETDDAALSAGTASRRPIMAWVPFTKELDDAAIPRLRTGRYPVDLTTIPARRVAACLHEGDPERLEGLERALVRFLTKQGYRPTGRTSQVFLHTDEDVAAWRTEVQVELEPAP